MIESDTETPEISDEELIQNAEEIFLELDKREAFKTQG